MFSKYFSGMQDVSYFPIVAFLIFFGFFSFMLLWLFTTNKKYFSKMGNIPFEPEELKTIKKENEL